MRIISLAGASNAAMIATAVIATTVIATTLVTAAPASAERPVVLELFTSEGCSSCPPADALLRELSRTRADVLALGFHVTYWNNLGWADPFSFPGATDRQRAYSGKLGTVVYTPQLVVDGRIDVVGSDRHDTLAAIRRAQADTGPTVPMSLRREGGDVVIELGATAASAGVPATARVLLVGYDPEHTTAVGRGENAGHTLVEANIVRGVVSVGDWTGTAATLRHAAPNGARVAVLLQAADGRILGVARETEPHAS